jgi:hypothetical protein
VGNTVQDADNIFAIRYNDIPKQYQPEIDLDDNEAPNAADATCASSNKGNNQMLSEVVQLSAAHETEHQSDRLYAK